MDPKLQGIGLALLIIIAAYLLSSLSGWVLRMLARVLVRRTQTSLDDVILRAARMPLRIAIFLGGTDLALRQISGLPDQWQEALGRLFFVLYALIAYLFLYRLTSGVLGWYGREISKRTETEVDDQFLNLFRRIALLALTVIAIIILLGRFGVEVSALVTTLGIGSLAVALAAQETLGDMISGFTILIDQPFKVGDRVAIQEIDTWGDVIEIGLRSTRILTRDNRMVSVPNSVIGKGMVVNYSVPDTVFRVETHVGVAFGTDLERARQIMIGAVAEEDWVMKDKPIEALMLEFAESALVFRVRCWIEHYVETRRIIDKLNSALYQALNREGIVIPLPQRELHIASGDPGLQPSRKRN